MHVKRLEPLRLSGRPPHPHKGLARLSNIVGERQRKFHVRGYVPGIVSGVPVPCSDRVPRYYIQQLLGRNPGQHHSTPSKLSIITRIPSGLRRTDPSEASGKLREVEFVMNTRWQEAISCVHTVEAPTDMSRDSVAKTRSPLPKMPR